MAPSSEYWVVDLLEGQRLVAVQLLEDSVLVGQDEGQSLAEGLRVDEVGHADAGASHLVGEAGPDAAAGGADGGLSPQLLVQAVDDRVIGHDDVAAVADEELLDADAAFLQGLDLLQQDRRDR